MARSLQLLSSPAVMAVAFTATAAAAALLSGCDALDDGTERHNFQTGPVTTYAPRSRPVARLQTAPAATTPDYVAPEAIPDATPTPDTSDEDTLAGTSKMPTAHSHWLRGMVTGARVSVQINGKTLGDIAGPLDRDITMLCRAGANTATFTYTPTSNSNANAHLQLIESEHDVPIPALVNYRHGNTTALSSSASLSGVSNTPVSPETETFVFTAH